MKFVTLTSFENTVEAHLLKSKLESEGIICFLKDEYITNAYQQYSYPFGGVKLMVRSSEYAEALNILNLIEDNAFIDYDRLALKCPNCNSVKIQRRKSIRSVGGIISLLITLLFSVIAIKPKTLYRCNNCSTDFETSN